MNKKSLSWIHIFIVCLIAILISSSGSLMARAGSESPAEKLQQAWRNAQQAGSYRFVSDINQTFVPRPVPEMIGQQETPLSLAMDGAVILPDSSYSEMKVLSNQISESVVMIRDGQQTFMLQDGQLKPVDNTLNLASQSGDMLSYLVAADQVTLLDPPENHPELARYGFIVDGPRYAEYIRQQAQAAMRSEPGAPQELTLQPMPALQQISGQGELWVNRDGFPVRQVLDLKMPQVNEQYGVSIHMLVDLSGYGKVASLPQAVQGPDGSWQLNGTLEGGSDPGLGAFTGFGTQPAQALTSEPSPATAVSGLKARLASLLPLQVNPTSVILFVVLLLVLLLVRYYRRSPKHCYALIVFILIPIMVLSPVLESAGVVRFFERQAQAAEESAAAVPELLHSLGLNVQVDGSSQASSSAADPAALTPQQILEQAAANKPENAPVYDGVLQTTYNQGQQALGVCGYGEPGVDTDEDGLTDQVENCLGTVSDNPDTDSDLIPDGLEVMGFDYGGKHWSSDPLNVDSNRDGNTDTMEWPATITVGDQTLDAHGQAVNIDLDGDGIPNMWDDDDDGDGVPDAFDLSPAALTGYTTEFNFSSQGSISSGTQAIEIEVQPQNLDHLRYSTTLLDWPFDEDGNVQDLDNSTEDLRLVPFLLVTTNVMPSDDLLAQYGTRGWYDEEQGKYILLVTLQPQEDGGAIYAFYGKVAYAHSDLTQDIQWNAKVVWMAQMQQDSYTCRYLYYEGRNECDVNTNSTFLHQYQETFRVTGLQVTKSESFESSVIGTPGYPADDLYLFKLLIGLNNTFQLYESLENQGSGETALDELYTRFTEGDTITHTFGVPAGADGVIAMTEPGDYPNAEAGMADTSNTVLPNFLNYYPAFSTGSNCQDIEGNAVTCASLVLVSENHLGTQDLSRMRGTDPRMVALDQLNVNLSNIPVFVSRNTNLRMYEKNSVTNAWETMTPARMLEMVEARYHDDYATIFNEVYPSFQAEEARFIAYTAYLWAYGGLFNVISMDEQVLVPELPDEQAEALASAVQDAFATSGLDYIGFATNLPGVLSDTFNSGAGIYQVIDVILKRATPSTGAISIKGKIALAGLGLAGAVASIIMDSIGTACAANPDLKVCGNETVLLVANLMVGALNIGVQTVAIAVQIADAVIDYLAGTIAKIDIAGCVTGIIGAAVGIAMAWVAFGLIAGKTDDPVAWRMALALAIVTTVWLIVLAAINFIPVIGPIITAILGLIDYILGLITNLFGKKQWSLAQVILEFFYSAATDTSLESAAFGEFSSGLSDPDMGLVGGNSFEVSAPASGVINKEDRGDDDDLRMSYVAGILQPTPDPSNPPSNPIPGEAMNADLSCPIYSDKAYCTNTAKVGFALEPVINGTANFVARIIYRTVWEEDMLYGAIEVKHHYPTGELPEADELQYNSLAFDVLPATLTGLWEWSALGNPDKDGDGLTNDEEAALGTDPTKWDSDGDSLSDWYEVEVCSSKGCDPMNPDVDGDGLNDAMERRVGTRINQADSDGDGISDADELLHLDANGELAGGWHITLGPLNSVSSSITLDAATSNQASFSSGANNAPMTSDIELLATGDTYWVSSDPLIRDDDADNLNAYEERDNGLSPQATNAQVPQLIFNVSPIAAIPDARPGAYWLPGTLISITITLANFATGPVTTPLSITLPYWIASISGGVMQGDRTPPATIDIGTDKNTVTWDFSGANTLQLYEVVSTTVTAQVSPEMTTGGGEIALDLLYGATQLHKVMQITVDGDNPDVSIIAPTNNAFLRGSTFVVGGLTTDRTTWITERSLSITPQGGTTEVKELPVGQGLWAYTWEFPSANGVYTLSAYAKDAMEHVNTSGNTTVTVDNTPPVATLSYQMVDGTVHLSGDAADNLAGVQWVQLMIDNQPWRSVPLDGSTWSYDWQVGENAQGKHTVKVRAIDYSRNQSEVVIKTITVDSVAPSSVVTVGADPDIPPVVQPNTSFDISGVADEGGHLPKPATPADLNTGMNVFDDGTVWLGISTIHENDGGVLAAWIGDFNADRLSDLAVGLPGPEGDAGQVAILYGRAGGWPISPDLEMLASTQTHYIGLDGARMGSILAAAGDLNADSRDDLLVAGRSSTDAYLIFGNPNPLGDVTLETGKSGYRVLLQAPDTITGLAAAGDVDGDGFSDLLIQAGTTAYLVLGRGNPWPETIEIASDAAASFTNVSGALGVGDVDNDQLAEWVTLASSAITLYGWTGGTVDAIKTVATTDTDPHVVALGDVDSDGYADWLYSDGDNRSLAYGAGGTRTFTGYNGFFAAPGDVDGDGHADILLTDSSGTASLIGTSNIGSLDVFATIDGVGGAANAPYAAGADLNADGSADLLLIPSQEEAESRGFDAPDFSSGFISPQNLPLGVSSDINTLQEPKPLLSTSLSLEPLFLNVMAMQEFGLLSASSDVYYVDDDAVNDTCDGHSSCYTTIQAAVNASGASGGGEDKITVYPGVYPAFSIPAGAAYDYLTVEGVSPDTVFIDNKGAGNAISIAADGVHLSNLTVRNADSGIVLQDGAGEPTWEGGKETTIDHLLAHSVKNPISISQSAALELSDSTLVGNGTDPILKVGTTINSGVHTWHTDRGMSSAISLNGGLTSTGGKLYAMPGGFDSTVYTSIPNSDGTLGSWSPAFRVPDEMPLSVVDKNSLIAAGGNYFFQAHPRMATRDLGAPDFSAFNGEIRAVDVAPNGDIYVGGGFTTVGTTAVNHVARWNGSQWSPLGTALSNGVNGTVYAITIVPNGDVYVGGLFSQVYGGTNIPAHNIARWSNNAWLTLGEAVVNGNGTDGPVNALAHTDDGVVAVGGQFEYVRASLAGYNANQFSNVRNFALYDPARWPDDAGWYCEVGWMVGSYYETSAVHSLVWSGGNYLDRYSRFIIGGAFSQVGPWGTDNITEFVDLGGSYGDYYRLIPLTTNGISVQVSGVAIDRTTSDVYAVSSDPASEGVYRLSGNAWVVQFGYNLGPANALTVDARGNIYVGTADGRFCVDQPYQSGIFDLKSNEGAPIWAIVPDSLLPAQAGQVLVARGSTNSTGAIRHWSLEGVFRRPLSGTNTNWEWVTYPIGIFNTKLLDAIAADNSGNLYVTGHAGGYSYLSRLNAGAQTWDRVATLSTYLEGYDQFAMTDLVWANGYLYGLAFPPGGSGQNWYLYRYDPASPVMNPNDYGPNINWTQIGLTPLPTGISAVSSRSFIWDGADSIYLLQSGAAYRYRTSTNTWDTLATPPTTFTLSQKPSMAFAGSNLYVYATPGTGVTTNLFRYGAVGMPDQRLTIRNTALVEPDSATSSLSWTSLSSAGGTYRFQVDAGTSNAWVGPISATWTPALPGGATTLTSTQADFVAPEDDLYRLGANSILGAGYNLYMAVAHVYPSQADCVECIKGSATWGEDAFATIREAVESGAARVLVHPGRYPQTFFLVSGVEVIGSGAETTIIEPPEGSASTLVTAEGVAHASLARMTLAGDSSWDGFLAEGGATGLKLSRMIIRGLDTGVSLNDDSEVEITNNTIVENTNGVVMTGTTPVNVRNTIFAYNTGTGLQYDASPTSLSNTYNDFWANGTDMARIGGEPDPSLGSLFLDPRFRDLVGEDFRLAANSPLIDMGSPNDPTVPGGGERVDIGYAEFNSAGFYVSKDYSETGLNDGLTWGIEAFNQIQPALDAAAETMHSLQGAVPQGGFSVGVKAGTYIEQVSVPSHVRLVGSGAENTTIDAGAAGSAVTFNAVIDSELTGFTVQNNGTSGVGVEITNAANGIKIYRNVIVDNSTGIILTSNSSAQVLFSTIVDNSNAGVYASGLGSWADVRSSILDGNGTGLKAENNALIRNSYNLLNNTTDLSSVTAGEGTLYGDPAFMANGNYFISATSPALDAADPLAEVPVAGGLRADLGYKELIASPLTLIFGPQIDPKITGNTGVAQVDVGVVKVIDTGTPVTDTLPTSWVTLSPASSGQPLFYWSTPWSEAGPGFYRVYSRATDEAGNVETDPLGWYEGAFVVDDTAPTVTWVTTPPASTDAAAVLAAVNAKGTVPTAVGTRSDVTQVYFRVTQPDGQEKLYQAEGGKAWIQLPVANSGTAYTITAVAMDDAGNSTETSTQVTVSPGTSVATVTSPVSGSAVNTLDVTMHGFVRFSAAGTGELVISGSGVSTYSPVSITLDSPGEQFSAWSAEFEVTNVDAHKNLTITPKLDGVAGTTTTLDLLLDRVPPPSITFLEPTTTVIQYTNFFGHTNDTQYASGVSRVDISIDGGYTWRQATLGGSDYQMNWGYVKWDFGPDQDYVNYPVQVRATDNAGNIAVIKQTIVVDDVPPTGLAPVAFDPPTGHHLEAGSDNLSIAWNTPLDASGTADVLVAVDQKEDVDDNTVYTILTGNTGTASLSEVGDWYVHMVAKDAAGNQVITQYGPWHVREMTTPNFSDRRDSIILDGDLDLQHDEWQASDLLGIDARSGNPQELYASWDGQYVYLGWSGAWWTLDGVMWVYLDTADGGSNISVDGSTLPLYADQAVEINAPGKGSLWTWNGTWVETPLSADDFAAGQTGDTEVRVPWPSTTSYALNLVAYALPREAEQVQNVQAQTISGSRGLMSLAEVNPAAPDDPGFTPWAVFPTTNPLEGSLTEDFVWADVTGVTDVNGEQPSARTVYMTVTSPQATDAAWCGDNDIIYDILLENPDLSDISGLILTLSASSGLSYQNVTGASLSSGAAGDPNWTLAVPTLAAGASTHVIVTARLAPTGDLLGATLVESTIYLSAGQVDLTPESHAAATVTHQVDGQAPTVSIDTLGGSAISAGSSTFTGSAGDADGSGIARVEVSQDGFGWVTAGGTLGWSVTLDTLNETGDFTLHARSIDQCGYTSETATHTFVVDTTPPAVTWTTPDVVTGDLAVISGTANDPVPVGSLVKSVEVQLDSVDGAWKTANLLPAQSWIWSWVTPREDGVTHDLRVRAKDTIGNVTTTDWQSTVVDTVPPQLTVDQDKATPLVINPEDGSVLTGSVMDGGGVQSVSILIYGLEGGTSILVQRVSLTGESWTYIPDLANWIVGTYALRVQAEDIHGNTSMEGPYQFVVTEEMLEHPGIAIDTLTVDGTFEGDGMTILAGESITWKYMVTNIGDVPLSDVSVDDSETGVSPTYVSGDENIDGKLDVDETWVYNASGMAAVGDYTNTGTAFGTSPAGATVTAQDGSSYFGANPGFTVSKECKAGTEPIPQEGPAVFVVTFTNTGNVDLSITADEDLSGGAFSITAGTPFDLVVGESISFEAALMVDFSGQAAASNTIHATSAFTDGAENTWDNPANQQQDTASCRVGSRLNLIKWTQGAPDPSKTWTFSLWAGVDGFGVSKLTGDDTGGVEGSLLDFGNPNLDRFQTYTLCEEYVPAGWTSFWQVDSTGDGVIDATDATLIPYNPNADDETPQDLGNRCVDIGAGTGLDLLADGGTLLLQVDNTYPGGEPRSAGYWKNWNWVTNGGQADNAGRNGGYENGYWLLENVLDTEIGDGITWDDILADDFILPITNAAVAVDILDQREIGDENLVADGLKHASDAAYTLAMELLAAQLNFGAGARTCDTALDAALSGEQLLDKYDFNGMGDYLLSTNKKVRSDYNKALQFANTLDQYNNSLLCIGPAVSFVAPLDGDVVLGVQPITVNTLGTVSQVEFFVDDVSIWVDNDPMDGWSIDWDSSSVAEGSHVLKAIATNDLEQTGNADVTIIVDNFTDPPVVKITSLVDGAIVSESSVEINANASSSAGVTKVEFFANDVIIDTDVDGTDGWSVVWNLNGAADGRYTLTATAMANDGQVGSDNVSVVVDNEPDRPVEITGLAGSSLWMKPNVSWEAAVTLTLNPLLEGASVTGSWSNGAAGTCTTGTDGSCSIVLTGISKKIDSLIFTVSDVTMEGYFYDPGDFTSVTISRPQ